MTVCGREAAAGGRWRAQAGAGAGRRRARGKRRQGRTDGGSGHNGQNQTPGFAPAIHAMAGLLARPHPFLSCLPMRCTVAYGQNRQAYSSGGCAGMAGRLSLFHRLPVSPSSRHAGGHHRVRCIFYMREARRGASACGSPGRMHQGGPSVMSPHRADKPGTDRRDQCLIDSNKTGGRPRVYVPSHLPPCSRNLYLEI